MIEQTGQTMQTKMKPNWLKKAQEGIQYLFYWEAESNKIYATKYHKNKRSTYEIVDGVCSCPSYRMTHNCCHIKILDNRPEGDEPDTVKKVEIISYVMNTYAPISKKVDVEYLKTTSPCLRFKLHVKKLPRCRLVFWWRNAPVIIDFLPENKV